MKRSDAEVAAVAASMLAGRAPSHAEQAGRLSPDESALAETPAFRDLRESLEFQLYDASHARHWYEERLQAQLRARIVPSWEDVTHYADARAREHYARTKLEELRLGRNPA